MKGSASKSKPFQRRNSRLSQAGRTAEACQIQIAVPNWFRRWTFHVLNSHVSKILRFSCKASPAKSSEKSYGDENSVNCKRKTRVNLITHQLFTSGVDIESWLKCWINKVSWVCSAPCKNISIDVMSSGFMKACHTLGEFLFFVLHLQICLRRQQELKFVGTSACRTLADFLLQPR